MTIAGVRLQPRIDFLLVLAFNVWLTWHEVRGSAFLVGPRYDTVGIASSGWALVAGLGAALVFSGSVLLHNLGHIAAARRPGLELSAMPLHLWGDATAYEEDGLASARSLAAFAAAGPLATAALLLAAVAGLTACGWLVAP